MFPPYYRVTATKSESPGPGKRLHLTYRIELGTYDTREQADAAADIARNNPRYADAYFHVIDPQGNAVTFLPERVLNP